MRDRSAAGAGASHHGGGTAGGTRRSVPFSGGGDGYGFGCGGFSEDDDRGMAGDGESRQNGGQRAGGGLNSEVRGISGGGVSLSLSYEYRIAAVFCSCCCRRGGGGLTAVAVFAYVRTSLVEGSNVLCVACGQEMFSARTSLFVLGIVVVYRCCCCRSYLKRREHDMAVNDKYCSWRKITHPSDCF